MSPLKKQLHIKFFFISVLLVSLLAEANSHEDASQDSADVHTNSHDFDGSVSLPKEDQKTAQSVHNSHFHFPATGIIERNGDLSELEKSKTFQLSSNYTYVFATTLLNGSLNQNVSYKLITGEIFINVQHPITFSTANGSIFLKKGEFIIDRDENSVSVSSVSMDGNGTVIDLTSKIVQELIPGTTVTLAPPHMKKDFVISVPMPFQKLPIIKKRLKAITSDESADQLVKNLSLLWYQASRWSSEVQQAVVLRQIASDEAKEKTLKAAIERDANERLYFRKLFEKNNHQDIQ